jgi:formylglycine-generating enzyme required for sulfatase activity
MRVVWKTCKLRTAAGLFLICFFSSSLCACTRDTQSTTEPPTEIISEVDGARMVLIPAGTFQMGSTIGDNDEQPVHTVTLNAFYMDMYEVTNARYQKFVESTGYPQPPLSHNPRFNASDFPVVHVKWRDAVAYATWANKRLPTEAEWEYAARGGLVGKRYPNSDIITYVDANLAGVGGTDKWKWTAPVGNFPPNGYDLYDIVGNVWEWCFDEYNGEFYSVSRENNPRFGREQAPDNENFRILRGGGWGGAPEDLRVADRWYHLSSGSTIGFRCVKDVAP